MRPKQARDPSHKFAGEYLIKFSTKLSRGKFGITMKKAGDRLNTHLGDERIEKTLHAFIAKKVARHIRSDTLIIVDPSDIQKPYATPMDFLAKVWDGSKGVVGDNHWVFDLLSIEPKASKRELRRVNGGVPRYT